MVPIIAHLTVHVNAGVFKRFHSKGPITKSIHVKVRSGATDFLHEARTPAGPFE